MEREDLKVGGFIWWEFQLCMNPWSCPCMVTYIGEKGFKVKRFDFHEVTHLMPYRDIYGATLSCMRVCDKEEVLTYFCRQEEKLIDKKRLHQDAVRTASHGLKRLKISFRFIVE